MKGFVKDPNEAKRYVVLDEDKAPSSPEGGHDYVDDSSDNPQQRKNIDLTKTVYIPLSMKLKTFSFFLILNFNWPFMQEFSLTNERFLVPEMIFRPADLGQSTNLFVFWFPRSVISYFFLFWSFHSKNCTMRAIKSLIKSFLLIMFLRNEPGRTCRMHCSSCEFMPSSSSPCVIWEVMDLDCHHLFWIIMLWPISLFFWFCEMLLGLWCAVSFWLVEAHYFLDLPKDCKHHLCSQIKECIYLYLIAKGLLHNQGEGASASGTRWISSEDYYSRRVKFFF